MFCTICEFNDLRVAKLTRLATSGRSLRWPMFSGMACINFSRPKKCQQQIRPTCFELLVSIGTHVFTALERGGGKGDMQWNVVSLVGTNVGMTETTYKALDAPANETDLPSAKAALDRIIIPEDTVDRIAQMVSPRSSLIISDEGPSSETSRGTEFVIVMSDEPQGGLAHRRPGPVIGVRYGWRSALLAFAVRKFVFFLVAAPALLIKSARSNCKHVAPLAGRGPRIMLVQKLSMPSMMLRTSATSGNGRFCCKSRWRLL
jgi:hypothetical protein